MFAFNPAQDDDHRARGLDAAALAGSVLRLASEYQAVLVEQDRD